jgi:hypothetical protein
MIPIMPDEEFQKLSEEEQNAQRDRELESMTEEDWDRFYFNCTGRHLGDPIPPEELVDMDEFLKNPDAFNNTGRDEPGKPEQSIRGSNCGYR